VQRAPQLGGMGVVDLIGGEQRPAQVLQGAVGATPEQLPLAPPRRLAAGELEAEGHEAPQQLEALGRRQPRAVHLAEGRVDAAPRLGDVDQRQLGDPALEGLDAEVVGSRFPGLERVERRLDAVP